MSKTDKVAGGLVGITRNEGARNRWSLTYNERATLVENTRSLFGMIHADECDEMSHKDCLSTGIK